MWRHGQTPAKQLLGMTVVVETTRKVAGWWRMLWRELVHKSAVGAIQLERGPGLSRPQAVDPLEELSPAAEQVVRAAEYLRQDMPDVALKLLRGAAEDARRRHDSEALHGLLRLMARIRARVPAQLAWQADLIAEIAQRGLDEARSPTS